MDEVIDWWVIIKENSQTLKQHRQTYMQFEHIENTKKLKETKQIWDWYVIMVWMENKTSLNLHQDSRTSKLNNNQFSRKQHAGGNNGNHKGEAFKSKWKGYLFSRTISDHRTYKRRSFKHLQIPAIPESHTNRVRQKSTTMEVQEITKETCIHNINFSRRSCLELSPKSHHCLVGRIRQLLAIRGTLPPLFEAIGDVRNATYSCFEVCKS